MKLIAATLLATAAMIGTARATALEAYESCWSKTSTEYLDQNGVSEQSLKWAVAQADSQCLDEKQKAGAEASEMRDYMEVQLYNANPVSDQESKIEKISGHQASTGWALYNARTGFLCQFPSDSEPMRQLVSTNRLDLARQKKACVVVDRTIEVEKIRQFGSTLQVRYVNAKGHMVEAFTSDRTFRTKAGWNEVGIE